jgi:hypothetical protein
MEKRKKRLTLSSLFPQSPNAPKTAPERKRTRVCPPHTRQKILGNLSAAKNQSAATNKTITQYPVNYTLCLTLSPLLNIGAYIITISRRTHITIITTTNITR